MDKILLIYNAAIKVMAQEGYYNTKVQMIANEADVAVGTIYHYFKSKEEILEFIFKDEFERRIKYLNELEKKNETVLNKIRIFLEFHLNEFIENPQKMKVIAQEMVLFTQLASNSSKELLIKMRTAFGKLIENGQQSGEIRPMDVNATATFIIHSIRAVIYTSQFKEDKEGYGKIKNEMIEFIINGLKR